MAKLEQGILGAFSGKVGTVVGYTWRGRACVRAYRKDVAYPNTPMQQAERDWFVSMVRFASKARQALKLGLREQADRHQMTEGNYFVMSNKRCFARTHAPVAARGGDTPSNLEGEIDGRLVQGSPSVQVDYDHIVISQGAAAPVRFLAPRFEEDEVISVDFEKNSQFSRASSEDSVYLFAYAPGIGEGYLSAPALRRSKVVKMRLPQHWAGAEVHLYGFVVDREGRASNSAYIGSGYVSLPSDNNDNHHGISEMGSISTPALTEPHTMTSHDANPAESMCFAMKIPKAPPEAI